jgi:hypothetical protein
LHASATGQSVALLQPHVPLTHTPPASAVTQLEHMPPARPQVVAASPGSHVVPLQQTPLQVWVDEHVVVHAPVATSHASPTGQWLDELHPASPESCVPVSFPPPSLASLWLASLASPWLASLASAAVASGAAESLASGSVPSLVASASGPPSGVAPSASTPASISDRSKLTSSSQPIVVQAAPTRPVSSTKARVRCVIPSSAEERSVVVPSA